MQSTVILFLTMYSIPKTKSRSIIHIDFCDIINKCLSFFDQEKSSKSLKHANKNDIKRSSGNRKLELQLK
jgi:hypothetical protein